MAYLDENGLEHFWGKIKDHVSSAVAPKANDADVVHKTGDETVGGLKTFQNSQNIPNTEETGTDFVLRNPEVSRGTPLESGRSWTRVIFADKEGDTEATQAGRLGLVEIMSPKEGDTIGSQMLLSCYKYSSNPADYTKRSQFTLGYDGNGIPYATAPSTSDDRTNSTDIVTRGYMEASEWNWQKSKKNVLVQLKPVPESDLEPVVDFMFTETPPAEGEKGPENPSVIAGISTVSVKRQSKNLLTYYRKEGSANSIVSVQPDGSLLINGTVSEGNYVTIIYVVPWNNTAITPNTSQYIISVNNAVALDTVRISCRAPVAYGGWASVDGNDARMTSVNFTKVLTPTHENAVWDSVFIQLYPNTYSNLVLKPQLELGTVATKFEPSDQNAYAIQLGDTYYGGSLDVATGVMTVTWHGTKLTSASDFRGPFDIAQSGSNKRYVANLPYGSASYTATNQACSHYNYSHLFDSNIQQAWVSSSGACYIYDSFATVEELNEFLDSQNSNGTPVVICYQLASPYTVQLTPTQIRSLPALDKYEPRINTVYTDQEAVQVGYQRYVAEDGGLVHKTGDEVITGYKQFYATISIGHSTNAYERAVIGSVTDGIRIGAESMANSRHGGMLTLYGKTSTSEVAGNFVLHATNTSSSHSLVGRPNGTLTWDYKDITGDVHTTGNNVITAYDFAWRNNDTSGINISGGSAAGKGARLVLCGKSHGNNPGQFILHANNDNGSDIKLVGNPSGTLSWNGQTIQTTSDERLKTTLSEVPDAVLDAWEEVNWGQFQYLDAVASKGESARLHLGLIAQHVMSVFEKHGLDACAYGILCHEEREAVGEDPAVDLWMVRYAEAQAMEACCMRRENARLKKRIADLEERLAALELKIS